MASLVGQFRRAFPPPGYLVMNGAGIDISTGSVKTVVLEGGKGNTRLGAFQKIDLEQGVIVDGDIEKTDKLVDVLRTLRLRERIRFAHASLLERKAYLYQTIVPKTGDLRTAVEFTLEGHVPIPPSEAVFDFEVVRSVEAGVVVAVTAYAKRIVEAYHDAFMKAGIMLRSVEVESQGVARALLSADDRTRVVMVIDFGKQTTRIAIMDNGAVSFTATVDVGGDALTSAAMKHFGVSQDEAEKIKNEQGFLEGGKSHELYEAMMLTISVLRDEVVKHITFWNNPDQTDPPRRPIEKVYVIGGNANLKGLPEFLSRSLQLPVVVGNVWSNAFSLDRYVPPMPMSESLQYATAIGLALRSHSHAW